MSSLDLTVPAALSTTLQIVAPQSGGASPLALATNEAAVVNASDGFVVAGPGGENSFVRLVSANKIGLTFTISIDTSGNLNFVTSSSGVAPKTVLSISSSGVVSIPQLSLPTLSVSPAGSSDVCVGSSGVVYKQG